MKIKLDHSNTVNAVVYSCQNVLRQPRMRFGSPTVGRRQVLELSGDQMGTDDGAPVARTSSRTFILSSG